MYIVVCTNNEKLVSVILFSSCAVRTRLPSCSLRLVRKLCKALSEGGSSGGGGDIQDLFAI